MGRRKKESQPPIKLVIGRSPEQNKGQYDANYTVLTQSGVTDATGRGRRKASNSEAKKWKEHDSDDDDLEIVQVYKPPASFGVRSKAASQPQTSSRPPLVMHCIDDDLSAAQRQAYQLAQLDYERTRQKINSIKRSTNCVEVILDSYVSPEILKLKDITQLKATNRTSQRASSPDVVIVDGPGVIKNKTTSTVPHQPPMSAMVSIPRPIQPAPGPLPLLIRPNLTTQVLSAPRQQDAILMNSNGIPLVIPTQFITNGSQPIVLQTNQATCLQVISSGVQTGPMLGRPLIASSGSMGPSLAPKMSTGVPNVSLPPPPPLQCMAKNGQKRPPVVSEAVSQPPAKRSRGRRKISQESDNFAICGVDWVPLDEYYYSKKEGDPTYTEEKGEYRFKCFCCLKMLYNNLRTMMHIQGHIDSEKQQNLDLSDLTQCKYCYKQFDTPFEMQCHVEKIHQNHSNVLVCRICEKDHKSQSELKSHMHVHNACEMPYICQLCNFRSSVYADVVDHFKKRHDSSRYVLCLYCLKVFEIRFAKTAGWGMTQNYYQHLMKHQLRAAKLKCSRCKLLFIGKQELHMHKNKDHLPNYRGTQSGSSSRTVNASSEQVMICVPESSKSKVKSLNAPASQKSLFVGYCHFLGLKPEDICMECQNPMLTPEHYKKYTECSMCRFATICNEAFALHMYNFHIRGSEKKSTACSEKHLPKPLFCRCGYSSNKGNEIANHLVLCSKRTCYDQKPEVKWFEYDDEQEDFITSEPYCKDESINGEQSAAEKDIPSLFGVLGLVKKSPSRFYHRHNYSQESSPLGEPSPAEIANEIIEDILDRIFPAEAAAGEFIDNLLFNLLGQIGQLEKRKYCSASRRAFGKRRSVKGTCSKVRPSSSQRQDVATAHSDHSEGTMKSSEFTGSGTSQAGDQDVASCTGSDFKQDDSSIDSDPRMSASASSASENKESFAEDSSNMEWSELNSGTGEMFNADMNAEGLTGESNSHDLFISSKCHENEMMEVDSRNNLVEMKKEEVLEVGFDKVEETDEEMTDVTCVGRKNDRKDGSCHCEAVTETSGDKPCIFEEWVSDCKKQPDITEASDALLLEGDEGQEYQLEDREVEPLLGEKLPSKCQKYESTNDQKQQTGDGECESMDKEEQPSESQKCESVHDQEQQPESQKCESVDKEEQPSESQKCESVHNQEQQSESQKCESVDKEEQPSENQKCESVHDQEQWSENQKYESVIKEEQPSENQKYESVHVQEQWSESLKYESVDKEEQPSESQKCESVNEQEQMSGSEKSESVDKEEQMLGSQKCASLDDQKQLSESQKYEPVDKEERQLESQKCDSIDDHKKAAETQICESVNKTSDGQKLVEGAILKDSQRELEGKPLQETDQKKQDTGQHIKLDSRSSRDRHSHHSSYEKRHHHSESHSRDTSHHRDHSREYSRSSESYSRHRSHYHRRSSDKDRSGQYRHQDYYGSKGYHGSGGRHHEGDRRDERKGHRDGSHDHHGNKGYY